MSFLDEVKNPAHYTEWGEGNFESLFSKEKGIRWSSLVDRVKAEKRREQSLILKQAMR